MCRENCVENICYERCLGNVLSARRLCDRGWRSSRIRHSAGHRPGVVGAVTGVLQDYLDEVKLAEGLFAGERNMPRNPWGETPRR